MLPGSDEVVSVFQASWCRRMPGDDKKDYNNLLQVAFYIFEPTTGRWVTLGGDHKKAEKSTLLIADLEEMKPPGAFSTHRRLTAKEMPLVKSLPKPDEPNPPKVE